MSDVEKEILYHLKSIQKISNTCSKSGYLSAFVSNDSIFMNNIYWDNDDCIIPIDYHEFEDSGNE